LHIAIYYQAAECNFRHSELLLSETKRITLLVMQEYGNFVRSFKKVVVLSNNITQIVNQFQSLHSTKNG